MSDAKKIGDRIKKARAQLGYNQAQLSQTSGITPAAISQIESGLRTPSTPILRKLALILKVSTDYLLGNTDEPELKDLLQNEDVQKFYREFKDLKPDDQKFIQQQIEFMKMRKQK